MKEIELVELRFYNIQSYGNNLNTFKFKRGITWIMGPNGTGKSTIIEALTYVLFGTPYKEHVNLENLINTTNKKSLLVELDFIIHSSTGSTKYTVKRGMKPKVFTIEEDGVISSRIAGMNQKSFEEEILGFDTRLFTNAISLNTLETKPFIDMKSDEKRKFIESAISFDTAKLKKKISGELAQANVKMTTSVNDIRNYSNKITEFQAILASLEREKEFNITEFQGQLEQKKEIRQKIQEQQAKLKEELDKLIVLGKEVNKKLEAYKDIDTKIKNLEQVLMYMDDILVLKETFATKTTTMMDEDKSLKTMKKAFATLSKKYHESENLKKYDYLEKKIIEVSSINFGAQKEMDKVVKLQSEITIGVPCPVCKKPSTEEDKDHLVTAYREDWKTNNKIFKESKKELDSLNKTKEEFLELKKEFDSIKVEYTKNEQIILSQERALKSLEAELVQISSSIEAK